MAVIFGLTGLIGFLLSASVHISTFTNFDVMGKYPMVMALHVGAIVTWIGLFVTNRSLLTFRRSDANEAFSQMFKALPMFSKALIVIAGAYCVINLMICAPQTKHSAATVQAKQQQDNMMLRAFSGHWMFFYLVPTLFALNRRPRRIA